MTSDASIDIPAKPRVLIADDSRIVRATLTKHIEGMFEYREALDGEQAWETLLLDPNIRVVITDLTMPKLDGYGLLQRIRSSKISRIRNIPVVVISGTEEQEERERAKAAGATELITKGIGTAQLLSRLGVLAELVGTQGEGEPGREPPASAAPAVDSVPALVSDAELQTRAEALLADSLRDKRDFVVLHVSAGLRPPGPGGVTGCPSPELVSAMGGLLLRSVRQTDCVAQTGVADFTIATGSINFDAARLFAQRVCLVIARANLANVGSPPLIACCGLTALSDRGADKASATVELMCAAARRRAGLGMMRAVTGVVGVEEESAWQPPA